MNYEERLALMEKIEDVIGEHVEGYVFIAKVDDALGEECVMHRFDGGRAQALGLLRQTQIVLETEIQDEVRAQNSTEE